MTEAFRFGVNMISPAEGAEWGKKCRRAEELGYDTVLVADHLGMMAPFPALTAAAGATERVRIGTFVLNAGFWNPALLAREAATVDALSGGRLELGLGTGYVQSEHEAAGLPWGSARERVDHLRDTVKELERLFGSAEHQPAAVQRPRPTLLVGGNGDRVLRLAARHADIVAFSGGRTTPEGTPQPLTADQLEERVAVYQRVAAERPRPAELNLLLQSVVVTEDRERTAEEWRAHMPHLSAEELLEVPILAFGTVEEIADRLQAHRKRYGFSYFTVLDPFMETFAPVLAELRRREGAATR
ncbi:LLM class F420-dependent oxidoreductase [Streptomyces sp. NPDC007088]|uniref:LLM class F420-dependent oxidoreductase n=1 Tax=Streptomyces sp. NPDC007088 TaxID=3364773 RepID=UPI00368EAF60